MNNDIYDKEQIVVDYFMLHPNSYIKDVSLATGIPKSSVQRYLDKNRKLINPETKKTIEEQLRENKERGNREGGIISNCKNDALKDENGRFIGNVSASVVGVNELVKEDDILFICTTYIENQPMTIDELVLFLKQFKNYTRDYVYKCLTDNRIDSLFDDSIKSQIAFLLDNNRRTFFKKVGIVNLSKYIDIDLLSDVEKKVLESRILGASLEDISKEMNLSHTTIMKIENKAIFKIKEVIATENGNIK